MSVLDLESEYFDWLYGLVLGSKRVKKKPSYFALMHHLDATEFVYILPMDGNRFEDGVALRYRFGYENDYDDEIIAKCLDIRPCSVLEMMVALAVRCEEHIMWNPDLGDRTGRWFWTMIENLGLQDMDDENFDMERVDSAIFRFLNRDYERDGEGGLFRIERSDRDMRSADIWYQMNWYLSEVIEKEG